MGKRWLVVVFVALAPLVLCSFVSSASAATGFALISRIGEGELAGTGGVAVSQSSGDVYVVDTGASPSPLVRRYDSSGNPLGSWAVSSPGAIAVDGSAGESAGDVYVADTAGDAIDKFDAEGKPLGELTETTAGTPFAGVGGLAVDGEGDLWVSQPVGELDRFDGSKANKFVGLAFIAPEPFSSALLAVDGAEHIYLPTAGGVEQFGPKGEDLGQVDPNGASAAVAEPATNELFVNDGFQVGEYDEGRQLVSTFGGNGFLSGCGAGIAVHHADRHVYVGDGCNHDVLAFAPVTLPAVTMQAPVWQPVTSEFAGTAGTATFSATINPEGEQPISEVTWRFEYSADGGSTWNPLSNGTVPPGAAPVTVTRKVPVDTTSSLLRPNQTYLVRLSATDAGGALVTTQAQELTTPTAPIVVDEFATPVTSTTAGLHADIVQLGADTTYHLEWGTADCSTSSCTHVPVPDADIGATSADPVNGSRVTQIINSLTPNTTYHYRFVATSAAGTAAGPDQTIHTFAQAQPFQLPEGRAYELVSPPDKDGGSVQPNATRTRVATDGSAFSFVSLTSFGDAIGNGNIAGTEYMSVRSATGWATHAITPPQIAPPVAPLEGNSYLDAFSSDLSKGVFFSVGKLTQGSGNTDGVRNLYLRDDLRTPGVGHYTLLSDSSSPLAPVNVEVVPKLALIDHTPDFSHILFEGTDNLTPDATGTESKLYEWDNGTLRLAGVLPDSACANPPCLPSGSVAGRTRLAGGHENYTTGTVHTISADGRRILFAPTEASGALYMRIDHSSTIQINVSEKTNGIDPNGSQPASLQAATPDLSRVFFTTTEQLTNDDNNTGMDLYMWEAGKPAGQRLTLISRDSEPSDDASFQQDRAERVLAISGDGSYVYFIGGSSSNMLVSGQPHEPSVAEEAIYVWHDGLVRWVAWASDPAGNSMTFTTLNQALVGKLSQATPDGRTLVFVAALKPIKGPGLGTYFPSGYTEGCHTLTPGNMNDNTTCPQVFVYSYATDRLSCASCDPTGAAPVSNSNTEVSTEIALSAFPGQNEPAMITADGSKVFFSTADPLVPEDTNGRYDAYEYDTVTGQVHLISTGKSDQDSFFANATPDGSNVFFLTRQRLVGIDTDDAMDLYDARVGGGIAAQNPPAAAPCSGELCRGAPPMTAVTPPVASITFSGAGNETSPLGEVATVDIFTRTVHGSAFKIEVSVSSAGRITIAGGGVIGASRSVSRSGTYLLTVRLTSAQRRALRHKRRLKLRLRAVYTTTGGASASAAVRLTVKR